MTPAARARLVRVAVCLLGAASAAAPSAAAAALATSAGEDSAAVGFVPLHVSLGGELLDTRIIDMNGDGRLDLVLAVLARRAGEAPRREIHIHPQGRDGMLPAEPAQVVPVLEDVIVFGCADVRAEPGRELLFMTRSGAFSYSLTRDGYRDNIRRLASLHLLFQVPDARDLHGWSYVLERPARDLVLLPGSTAITLWGPPGAGTASAGDDAALAAGAAAPAGSAPAGSTAACDDVQLGTWGDAGKAGLFTVKAPGAAVVSTGGARVRFSADADKSLFLGEAPLAFAALLDADVHYRAPALADVNGDGLTDLVLRQDNALNVALGTPDGLQPAFTRRELLPPWLEKADTDLELLLRDLDLDGDTDLLARVNPDHKGLDPVVFTYYVLINDGEHLLPPEAQQVLRLEASGTRAEITDVDADGRPDLVLTKWTLPTLTELVTGFRLDRASYVYFAGGERGGTPFQRKPALRDEQTFTLDSLQDALVLRFLSGDCSGDGIADLVEVDLSGHVAIRRVMKESGFLGGGDWVLEGQAWKRLDLGTQLDRMWLQDLNGDAISDLINPGDDALTIMLSRRDPEAAR